MQVDWSFIDGDSTSTPHQLYNEIVVHFVSKGILSKDGANYIQSKTLPCQSSIQSSHWTNIAKKLSTAFTTAKQQKVAKSKKRNISDLFSDLKEMNQRYTKKPRLDPTLKQPTPTTFTTFSSSTTSSSSSSTSPTTSPTSAPSTTSNQLHQLPAVPLAARTNPIQFTHSALKGANAFSPQDAALVTNSVGLLAAATFSPSSQLRSTSNASTFNQELENILNQHRAVTVRQLEGLYLSVSFPFLADLVWKRPGDRS